MPITHHASRITYDIYFVGVGGQGVLTIGEIITETAYRKGLPVNFYPTKGMAQRGGFVKAQLRLGREAPGPAIPEKGADLVIATEVSEALKAVRFVKPEGDFVLYAHVWAPTAVMLGKAPYPKLDEVAATARAALDDGSRFCAIPPEALPLYEGAPVADNIFTLGVVLGRTRLGELLPPAEVEAVVRGRWKRGVERNMLAFAAGLAFAGFGTQGSGTRSRAPNLFQSPVPSTQSSGATMTLQPLFYPRHVALVGSVSEGKVGFELLRQMLRGGYRDVFVVNPKAQGALDVPSYATIAAIPAPVDLAVISSPAATVAGILEECGQVGVKAAVIISSGFSEMGNKAGEVEIKAIAARHGIRIVGPNCAGIINTSHRLCPTMETLPPPGPVALISQSGALAGVVLGWAARDGLGISKFVSYGNRADINEVDLLEYLANDEETRVVGLYIETVSDGRAFMAAAAKCAARKPVIVIKAGRGESGQRATLSHTGSLAGSDAVYDAALRQCGAIRVESAEEMFDLCRGFVGIPQGIRGRRIAIVTNSGGPSILAADRAEAVGLDVAEPGPAIRAKLASFLPPHAALKNPIDLTVEGTERGYREALIALLAQDEVKAEVEVKTDLNQPQP